METEFYKTIAQLKQNKKPFSVATVIHVRGSTSAKPGSKAVISEEGQNLLGWVGGGCAEKYICEQALETMQTGQTKIVEADLDDEIFGLGMPCGGVMQVFIEPFLQPLQTQITCADDDYQKAVFLAPRFQMEITGKRTASLPNPLASFHEQHVAPLTGFERLFLELSLARSAHFFPELSLRTLKESKGLSQKSFFQNMKSRSDIKPVPLVILGHSRISEEISQLALLMNWPVTVYSNQFTEDNQLNYSEKVALKNIDWHNPEFSFPKGSFVLVASHHKGDPEFIQAAQAANACYIGLVASAKRSGLVFEDLLQKGLTAAQIETLHAPAGLEINGSTPAHIALSALTEMILVKNSKG